MPVILGQWPLKSAFLFLYKFYHCTNTLPSPPSFTLPFSISFPCPALAPPSPYLPFLLSPPSACLSFLPSHPFPSHSLLSFFPSLLPSPFVPIPLIQLEGLGLWGQWRQRVSNIGGTTFPFPFPLLPSPPHLTPSPSLPTSPLRSK